MADPAIRQQSAIGHLSEATGPLQLVLPSAIQPDSTIVIIGATYHYQEAGVLIKSIADLSGNLYTQGFIRESADGSHGHVECWTAREVPARASGQTITITFETLPNAAYHRCALMALEVVNVGAIERNDTGAVGNGLTSCTVAHGSIPSVDGCFIIGCCQNIHATTYDKQWVQPVGFTKVAAVDVAELSVPSDSNSPRLTTVHVVSKLQTSAAIESATWGFSTQTFGSSTGMITFQPAEGAPSGQTVDFEVRADAVNAANPKASIYALPPTDNDMHGDVLFRASGADVNVGSALNSNGKVNISVNIPTGQSLSAGQQLVAAARGENPADSNSLWGSHFVPALVSGDNQWQLTVNDNDLLDKNGDIILLRGINSYAGALPYSLPYFRLGNNNGQYGFLYEENLFNSSAATISHLKASFGPTFNCIRLQVSPLALQQSVPGTFDYPEEEARLRGFIAQCAAEGIWVVYCPYGSGEFGDFESRAYKNEPGNDPNLVNANMNLSQPLTIANGGVPITDGNQDEINSNQDINGNATTVEASWMTNEVMAAHNLITAWIADKPNVILQVINEPRLQTDATWQAQHIAWINNIRLSYDASRPLIVHGHNWALNLPAAGATAIHAVDSNVIFCENHYRNSGSPFTSAMYATYRAAYNHATKKCIGVTEWGPTWNKSHATSANSPLEAAYPHDYQTWANAYHADLGSIPLKLYWMTLGDTNGIYGDPTLAGTENWSWNRWNVFQNPSQRELCAWATETVIPKTAI